MGKRKYGNPSSPKDSQLLLSDQIRSSQACDRCRLKKIKCDGLKPSCTSCKKVGFHCQTSDKLTRRGFPRGYTEMLEREVIKLQRQLNLVDEDGNTIAPGSREVSSAAATSVSVATHGADLDVNHKFHHGPRLPFVNDTFHYYSNYVGPDERYIGNATWNLLTDTVSVLSHNAIPDEDAWLRSYLVQQFQLTHNYLPAVLLSKYHGDSAFTRKRVSRGITEFFRIGMSLVPILSSPEWEKDLMDVFDTTAHPTTILALLLVIQRQWLCFSDDKLFVATKIVCTNSTRSLRNLQCMLLASYYFMGTPGSAVLGNASTSAYSSELLRLCFAEVVNMGIFINSRRLIPVSSQQSLNHTERLITFWCFQFLDSWWTLIQGTPKYNFTLDEFQPPTVSSLQIPRFKPFGLLVDFVVGSLDGCNFLHALSQGGASQLVLVLESFRKILIQYSLYHRLEDHEPYKLPNLVTNVETPQAAEIQLTLYYLVMRFFTDTKASQSSEKPSVFVEETAYEILTLYYLVLVNQGDPKAQLPQQLQVLHVLPCGNLDMIRLCLETLLAWAMSPQDQESDAQLNWQFEKYQSIVAAWCGLWYQDEPEDELLGKLQLLFKFNISIPLERHNFNLDMLKYLNSMKSHAGRPLILRPPANAAAEVIDPFDMFNTGDVPSTLPTSQHINALFNPQLSQETTLGQEEDDGYAEDDDEDEDTPLEIPFSKKRHPTMRTQSIQESILPQRSGSLFEQRHNKPAVRRKSDMVVAGSDHIILNNTEPVLGSSSKKRKLGQNNSMANAEHYSLVQGEQRTPPQVETPRSLVEMLDLPVQEEKETTSTRKDDDASHHRIAINQDSID